MKKNRVPSRIELKKTVVLSLTQNEQGNLKGGSATIGTNTKVSCPETYLCLASGASEETLLQSCACA